MRIPSTVLADEISLVDFWKIMIRCKLWVLGTPLVAMLVAAVAVTFLKPQWEAIATIQIGAVGQAGQFIEPPARVVERVKLRSFGDAVLARLGLSGQKTPETILFRNSLRVKAQSNTDLIEIEVRGYSVESAKRYTEATVSYLSQIHNKMATPAVLRMKQFLAGVEREIAQARAEREKTLKIASLKDKTLAETRFMENIVLANIMVQRDRELHQLEQTKMEYEEQLGSMRTYPTSYLEKMSVSEEPVAPKKSLIIVLAGVLGLLLGVIVALLRAVQERNIDNLERIHLKK